MWFHTLFAFIIGVVTGGSLVAIGIWYVLSFFFFDPKETQEQNFSSPNFKRGKNEHAPNSSSNFQLPPILLSKIRDESCKSKESCWAINFILYFLFRELKNSEGIRRWVLRKLSMEFDELLASSVLGKFFSSVFIQNIEIGENFPVVNWVKTTRVELHPVFNSISTLDILVDLDYSGGFQFSIQAQTHLRHSAFLSIKFNKVKGQARLQFATEPYAHWSFSFSENPEIDISVASQFDGKTFSQVTAIIAAQLKRSVRKKHTLPMYKIRYKPFFSRVQPLIASLVPNAIPSNESPGTLDLSILQCRGLSQSLIHGNVYATATIADFDFVAAYHSSPKSIYVVRDIAYIKTAKREANLDFTLSQQGDVVVIDSLNSPHISIPHAVRGAVNFSSFRPSECEFEAGDEIISVDSKKITTVRQCIKAFKNSAALRVIWRIRRNYGIRYENKSSNEVKSEIGDKSESRRGSGTLNGEDNGFKFTALGASGQKIINEFEMTTSVPKTRDPIFQNQFTFNILESDQFLNITFWSSRTVINSDENNESVSNSPSSSPAKKSKTPVLTSHSLPFGKDSVLGYLNIPISDIVTECSTTGMGYIIKDFYLCSPDGLIVDNEIESEIRSYSGFEPNMCFGKSTLSFLFKERDEEGGSNSKKTTDSSSTTHPTQLELSANGPTSNVGGEGLSSPTEDLPTHIFTRTHFRSSSICGYCNKKIWLKEAYICSSCGMKCHKKCNERCVANTICRGQLNSYANNREKSVIISSFTTPEIITTESEPVGEEVEDFQDDSSTYQLNDNEINIENESERGNEGGKVENNTENQDASSTTVVTPTPSPKNNIRRRTLGVILSAVQSRSSQLKRVGSASTLLSPPPSSSGGSKSLPPSPQSSPTTSRKASSSTVLAELNPFENLDPEGTGTVSRESLNFTIEQLIQNQNEDLVSIAKERGRDLYSSDLSIETRKQKLNSILGRLQEEIDSLTRERKEWNSQSALAESQASKTITGYKIARCEEKIQALALLMLHYCSGLQSISDIEDLE